MWKFGNLHISTFPHCQMRNGRRAPARRPSASLVTTNRRRPLEGEAEPELADSLLRLLEVAGEGCRLQEVRIRRLAGDRSGEPGGGEVTRVERVEEVEPLADRLDSRMPHQRER